MLRSTRRSLSASLFASLIACGAHAAELGEPRVASHIGQQLVADIELTLIEDANAKVEVRLASPEVYSEAAIAVPPVLSSLNLSVMRRDGRQFLHVTTLRPVQADHLHLYLELVDHGQRVVRLATLWLTPDPNPAPAALPAPAPAPASVAPPPTVPAPAPARVSTAAHAHAETEPAPPALAWTRPPLPATQPRPPLPATQPKPPLPATQPRPPLPVHTLPATQPKPDLPVRAAPATQPRPPLPAHALPAAKPDLPLPATAPAALPMHAARPAACLPQRGEAEACVVLGAKNAELRARIGQLEQRVKGLQASLGAGRQGKASGHEAPGPDAHAARPAAHGAAVSAAQTPDAHTQAPRPPARPAGPAPISSIKPLLPHKAKAPAPDDGLPWGLIGGAVAALAALGGVAALLRARRKRARKPGIPAQRGVLPRLRERFFTRNGAPPDADPAAGAIAEPTLE